MKLDLPPTPVARDFVSDRFVKCQIPLGSYDIHDDEFSPPHGDQVCIPRDILPVQLEWRIVAIALRVSGER